MFLSPEAQHEILAEGVEEVLPAGALLGRLERAFREGRPLRVKQGFDPTAPDIHLGHTVGLRKLRQFQDLGHQVVLIVGDYTGLVGDPSGRSKTRPRLDQAQIEENAQTYLSQFHRVLEADPGEGRQAVEVHRNSTWFSKMGFADVMALASHYTVARILERDDFSKRFREGHPISLHELFYPLMQGYDSVAVRADIELGGTEQKFNLIVGRVLQELHGMEPQALLTLPILPGLDGKQRMSKSLGNYIGVLDEPADMFGKVMSLPDSMIEPYALLVSGMTPTERLGFLAELRSPDTNPMHSKKMLAFRIVKLYHGPEHAAHAQARFETQFTRGEVPKDLAVIDVDSSMTWIQHLLVHTGLARSGSDARRAIVTERSVYLDGDRVVDSQLQVDRGREHVLKRGRRLVRIGASS